MSERLSFYQLVKEKDYLIEIPVIQRDFAQGRKSAGEIRQQFLEALKDYLSGESSRDLDFVYGSLSQHGKYKRFTPLDGQQRLTTLFLLHWYLATKDQRQAELRGVLSYKPGKSKFSYETRISSREFCDALISNDIIIPDSPDEKVSDAIRDCSWYFLYWENDPTIKSMMVVIDDIHKLFYETTGNYDKLIDLHNPLICFQFIELKNFGLTDSLYVKMNSRGIELTNFENFKAKFEQLLDKSDKENNTQLKLEFSKKIDTDWTDLFWKYRDENTNLFDDQLMNFIRVISTNIYALQNNNRLELEQNIKILIDRSKKLSFSNYLTLNCINKDGINDIMQTLDYLKNGNKKVKAYLGDYNLVDEARLFERVIQNQLTYAERVQFFSLYKYLIFNGGNATEIVSWMRVVRNLTENTIYDDASIFARSIKSVYELLPKSDQILSFLASPKSNIAGFAEIQVLEEKIKAILILKGNKWETLILKAENHNYFKGQIDFLLKFSGIKTYYLTYENLNWTDKLNDDFYKEFTTYFEKAGFMFSAFGLKEYDKYLWQRALLVQGDYMLSSSKNDSFLIDAIGERDVSWKRLLRDDNAKRDLLKSLFDQFTIDTAKKDLEKIINDSDVTGWRKYFIERPEILDVCGSNKFIRWEGENDILLLERSQTNGWHREYYSYALTVKLRANGNDVDYTGSNSVGNLKYINSINGIPVQISYEYANGDWNYCFKKVDDSFLFFPTEEAIIAYIKSISYLY